MRMVLNRCFGGFSLSKEACELLGVKRDGMYVGRTDERVIEVVEKLGRKANGDSADLEIVEIPDDVTDYEIYDYDGREEVIYVAGGLLHHA